MLDRGHALNTDLPVELSDGEASPATLSPTVAILIPAYKHSVLLTEAIDSALAQDAPFDIAVVIVDDGCPYPETAHVGQLYALSEPHVFYLRKQNGGLSSARNYGIEFALRTFPEVEAVYFLDADNRITPTAIREIFRFMAEDDRIDWVYPNIDKFGIEWNGNYTTEYSRLLHLTFDNICEAGSLVSRRLLDAGIRFDETMKSGFEDWDFWLQAIDNGFVGSNHPFFGFEYRQRAESMLRDSNRMREGILSYIRDKHKRLFAPETMLALEHEEAPRYAGISIGSYMVDFFTDPEAEHRSCGLEEFVRQFWAARTEPETFGIPPFLLWMTPAHRDALAQSGLIHNILWLGERLCEKHNFVAIRFETNKSEIGIAVREAGEGQALSAKPFAWMCSVDILTACVDDTSDDWVRTLRSPTPAPNVAEIVISGPFSARDTQGAILSATNGLLATLGAMRDSGYRRTECPRWIWRSAYLPNRTQYYKILRHAVGAAPIMPRLSAGEGPVKVGFLLPIASFGGVEKVAYAVARALKEAGCEPHLFILCKSSYARIPDNEGVFKSINFLADDYPLWGGPNAFSGHELLMGHDEMARAEEIMGFLSGLDVVVNNHVAPANAVLGDLRRRGVKIVNYIHVLDKSGFGRPAGHPYLSLAFEHIYDAILTCSRDMAEWLHAMGVPAAKLHHIRNAPSYRISAGERDALLAARRDRGNDRLNVLFLGRLDPQKGIERLYAAARTLQRRSARIDWRIVGSDVIDTGAGGSWKTRFEELGITVEPPVYASRHLSEAFAWADVVVLPSRWEGAPLTIIEAQRLGCVPVATAVGAVDELIKNGVDGVLIPDADDGAVTSMLVSALATLAEDPDRLRRLSAMAAERGAIANWGRSVEPLMKQLETWFPNRFTRPSATTRPQEDATSREEGMLATTQSGHSEQARSDALQLVGDRPPVAQRELRGYLGS